VINQNPPIILEQDDEEKSIELNDQIDKPSLVEQIIPHKIQTSQVLSKLLLILKG
jgi:hypothetical protein